MDKLLTNGDLKKDDEAAQEFGYMVAQLLQRFLQREVVDLVERFPQDEKGAYKLVMDGFSMPNRFVLETVHKALSEIIEAPHELLLSAASLSALITESEMMDFDQVHECVEEREAEKRKAVAAYELHQQTTKN